MKQSWAKHTKHAKNQKNLKKEKPWKEQNRTGGGSFVKVEEGIAGKRGDGGGAAAEGVLVGLLEVVVDVVGADVGPPCLLPLPRSLRRLPHRFPILSLFAGLFEWERRAEGGGRRSWGLAPSNKRGGGVGGSRQLISGRSGLGQVLSVRGALEADPDDPDRQILSITHMPVPLR